MARRSGARGMSKPPECHRCRPSAGFRLSQSRGPQRDGFHPYSPGLTAPRAIRSCWPPRRRWPPSPSPIFPRTACPGQSDSSAAALIAGAISGTGYTTSKFNSVSGTELRGYVACPRNSPQARRYRAATARERFLEFRTRNQLGALKAFIPPTTAAGARGSCAELLPPWGRDPVRAIGRYTPACPAPDRQTADTAGGRATPCHT